MPIHWQWTCCMYRSWNADGADVMPIHWQWMCCIIEVANMMTCWTVQWRDTHSLTVNVLYYRSSQHDDMLNGAVMWYPLIAVMLYYVANMMTCWTSDVAHSLTVNVLYYRSSQHDDMLNGAVTCDTHSLTVIDSEHVLYYRSSQHDDMLNGAVTWYPFIDSERVVL